MTTRQEKMNVHRTFVAVTQQTLPHFDLFCVNDVCFVLGFNNAYPDKNPTRSFPIKVKSSSVIIQVKQTAVRNAPMNNVPNV